MRLTLRLPSGRKVQLRTLGFVGVNRLTDSEAAQFATHWTTCMHEAEAHQTVPPSFDPVALYGEERGFWKVIEYANDEVVVGRVY